MISNDYGGGISMRVGFLIFLLVIFLLILPSQSAMKFKFEGHGKDGVMTTYCHLKEPRVEETGFSRGLKTGSFNYLDAREKGSIDVTENIDYFYGNGTNISGSSVSHSLNVDFNGTKGISEYYSRGFYDNNRVLSAWKKIRYEDTTSLNQPEYPKYMSDLIKVRAITQMDTEIGSYSMVYHAGVMNGVIETRDDTGWTNRTGAKRTDWEHETLSRGKYLNVTNELSDYELKTAAGSYDWLPCWFCGTLPVIEPGKDWPTQTTVMVLQKDTVFPTYKLQRDYYFSSPYCKIGNCSNATASNQKAAGLKKTIAPVDSTSIWRWHAL
jgi:hypothetical protein